MKKKRTHQKPLSLSHLTFGQAVNQILLAKPPKRKNKESGRKK